MLGKDFENFSSFIKDNAPILICAGVFGALSVNLRNISEYNAGFQYNNLAVSICYILFLLMGFLLMINGILYKNQDKEEALHQLVLKYILNVESKNNIFILFLILLAFLIVSVSMYLFTYLIVPYICFAYLQWIFFGKRIVDIFVKNKLHDFFFISYLIILSALLYGVFIAVSGIDFRIAKTLLSNYIVIYAIFFLTPVLLCIHLNSKIFPTIKN